MVHEWPLLHGGVLRGERRDARRSRHRAERGRRRPVLVGRRAALHVNSSTSFCTGPPAQRLSHCVRTLSAENEAGMASPVAFAFWS